MRLLSVGTKIGMWMLAKVAPASRSSRDTPSCVSAQAFSQLSQPTQSAFVDDQDVGGLAEAFLHQEVHQRARFRPHLHARVVDDASARILLQRIESSIFTTRQLEEFLALDLDQLGGDVRRAGGLATRDRPSTPSRR